MFDIGILAGRKWTVCVTSCDLSRRDNEINSSTEMENKKKLDFKNTEVPVGSISFIQNVYIPFLLQRTEQTKLWNQRLLRISKHW